MSSAMLKAATSALAARPSAIGQAPAGSASSIFRGIISSRSQAHRPRAQRAPAVAGSFDDPLRPSATNLSCVAKIALLDYLVGDRQQRFRYGQAERLGGLEIVSRSRPSKTSVTGRTPGQSQ